jgi:acyl-CoA synthetase (AMP-forming)/AMP-acid ligase II
MLLTALSTDSLAPRIRIQSDHWATDAELIAWANSDAVMEWRKPLVGKRTGIYIRNSRDLARTLLALDGFAAAIFLVPHDLAPETRLSLVGQAQLQFLVTDVPQDHSLTSLIHSIPPPIISANLPYANQFENANDNFSTQWILATSGTTRQPRLVSHTFWSLTRTVKKRFINNASLRWALLYDLNRFAGLQVFLQAIVGGDSLYIPMERNSIDHLIQEIIAAECSAVSATPTLWRKILMSKDSRRMLLRQITLGGEIADQPILNALRRMYPSSNIRHIYASTEGGVGFSVSDGLEGFPKEYLQNGFRGTKMRVSSEGILELKPPSRDQSYTADSNRLSDEEGFINTGDLVSITDDRVFFLGRDSGAINVGGNKVQPESVERVLLAHPAVAMAKVTGKKNPITGAIVCALVTVKDNDGSRINASMLRSWCAERLHQYQVPAIISIVDELRVESSGKLSRLEDLNSPS